MTEASCKAEAPTYGSDLEVEQLTEQELSEQITSIEKAVVRGKAQIDDYVALVACMQEMARRVRPSGQAHRTVESSFIEQRSGSRV